MMSTFAARSNSSRFSRVIRTAAIATVLTIQSAYATSYVWTGAAGNSNYTDPNNWSPIGVPGINDTATVATNAQIQGGSAYSLTNNAILNVAPGQTFSAAGTLTNTATIIVNGGYTGSGFPTPGFLNINATTPGQTATLTGGGTIALGDNGISSEVNFNPNNWGQVTNANNTIRGRGRLIAYSTSLINNGLISADISGQTLELAGEYNNANGIIEAKDGGVLNLSGTITGGTVRTTGGAHYYGAGALVNVTTTGTFKLGDGATLYARGTLNNTGTIALNGAFQGFGSTPGILRVDSTSPGQTGTLTGGGTVILGGNGLPGEVQFNGSNWGQVTNANNTIRGRGRLISYYTSLINNALISADISGQTLELAGEYNNANGIIEATDGGVLNLSGTITGGTVRTIWGGQFYGSGALVDVTTAGTFKLGDGATLYARSTLNNTGTLAITGAPQGFGYTPGILRVDATSPGQTGTLTGGGTVTLGVDGLPGEVQFNGSNWGQVTNANNTIRGRGRVIAYNTSLINNGIISADISGQTLELGGDYNNANGTIEGKNGGILKISGTVTGGTLQGTNGGVVQVLGSVQSALGGAIELHSGTLTPVGNASQNNLSSLTLSGGTLNFKLTSPDEYSAMQVTGTANLNSRTLGLTFTPGFSFAAGDVFNLLSAQTRVGIFNYAQGAAVPTSTGTPLYITYTGGDGNDVSLFALRTPASVPITAASPTDTAYVVGTYDGTSSPPQTTLTYDNLDLLNNSSFVLGPNETLDLDNGNGTLYVGEGSIFKGNGVVKGNIFNAGLVIIPITRADLIIPRITQQAPGSVVQFTPPPNPDPQEPVIIKTPPAQPYEVQPQTSLFLDSGSGAGGGGSGSGGGGGASFGTSWVLDTPNVQVQGLVKYDGELEVTGDYTQTDTGVLRLFIAGDIQSETYSYLNVGGAVALAGDLQIVLSPNMFDYLPNVGDSFDMIFAGDGLTLSSPLDITPLVTAEGLAYLSGFNLTPFTSGFVGDPDSLYALNRQVFSYEIIDGDTLRVTLTQSLVPEPTTLGVIAIGAIVLGRRQRRAASGLRR